VIVDIDEGGHAIASAAAVGRRLLNAGAGKVADRFRPVLVAALGDDGVELGHQIVVQRHCHSLHREVSQELCDSPEPNRLLGQCL
jgi:hypothetical protein